jgi:hypothetical protein
MTNQAGSDFNPRISINNSQISKQQIWLWTVAYRLKTSSNFDQDHRLPAMEHRPSSKIALDDGLPIPDCMLFD